MLEDYRSIVNPVLRRNEAEVMALPIGWARGEAIPAIDRFIATRIERHLRHAAALAAGRRKHLARTPRALAAAVPATIAAHRLARRSAVGATVGFVLEAFLLVEGLFAGTEDEGTSTVNAS
jgi:hypothetical protein